MMTSELKVLRRLKEDYPYYAQKCLKIVDKATGQIVPFQMNQAQRYIHMRLEEQKRRIGKVRATIIKGRQQGCSTYVEGRYFWIATLNPGSTVFILAHIADSTNHLFGMAKKYYELAPPPILPTIDKMNERRLEFSSIHSSYAVGTAGSAQIGRGTTVRYFHGSEVAYWEHSDDLAAGVLQAVPNAPGTEIIFESTANGLGGFFHKKVLEGLNEESDGEFITIFTPWFWQPEYNKPIPPTFIRTDEEEELNHLFGLTDGQLFWRRQTIIDAFGGDVWRFKREYPNTVEEGFLASGTSLILPSYIINARKSKVKDPMATVVGACDPARTGDRTIRLARRGREIMMLAKHQTMDEMTCAGLIASDIEKYDIEKYFVDVGCGYGTIDRLKEMGYGRIVTGVHFGQKAMQDDVYANKRAEMADHLKAWFEDGPVNIPDSDEVQADLASIPPLEKKGSRMKLTLMAKAEIKVLLGKSCDIFDTFMLSFAFPVASKAHGRNITRAEPVAGRLNSPLATVRDFNKGAVKATKTFSQDFKIN